MTKNREMENNQPVILERRDHPLSRKQIDPDALKVLYRLYRHGFKAYLVGGAVRDLLLGKNPKDFDVVTDARPGQIKKLFANCFLIGKRFRLAHIRFKGGKIIEVATFRKEPDEPTDESSEKTNTFGSPEEDAFRRDITINGLFYDISNFSIIDYVGGLEDIQRGIACIIGDPCERYTEDPVRIWRVLRHASRLNFTIEEATTEGIISCRDLLSQCSGARLFEELNKDMGSGFSCELFRHFCRFGILAVLFGKIGAYYEGSPDAFRILSVLLHANDSSEKSGQHLSPDARYTLLFWPWLRQLISERTSRDMDIIHLLHDAVMETDMPVVIPKKLKAGIVQTVYIVMKMCSAMETGRMRWSLKKRARYADAAQIFSVISTGEILPFKDPFEHIFRGKYTCTSARPRKKRHRRKKKAVAVS